MRQISGDLPLREQQRAFTRGRLMEAGIRIFARNGYPDATVDDVAREAGASRATFYLHFKSKGELAAALVDEAIPLGVRRYQDLDAMLCKRGPGLRRELRAWLSDWLGVWTEGASVSHAMQQAASWEAEVEAHMLHLSETLIDSLDGYFSSLPDSARADMRMRALLLEIMTQRIFALASRSRLPIGNEEVVDILTGMWWEVLVEGKPAGTAPVGLLTPRQDDGEEPVAPGT
jgi:AcrR family transcriptional regulator